MSLEIPEKGYIFWPVGNGDSSTILVDKGVFFQLDLNHMAKSEDDDDPHVAIIDELEKILPKKDKKPYLSLFALSHPDEDHCRGFKDFLKRITIGELWFSPRIFREYKKDLCDDAKAFRDEATRRVKLAIKNGASLSSGDRVRLIGYDDLLKEDEYKGFPRELLTIPGNGITKIDGVDYSKTFRAFVHAPFKEDSFGERNSCSLAFQIGVKDGDEIKWGLFFGDLCYPVMKKIFERSQKDSLAWNIFLAPHHCSKSVMYWKDEGEDKEQLKQDIIDSIEKAALKPGIVISSSEPVPSKNEEGDNPPHAKAKARYEEISPNGFICTQEFPNKEKPVPIVLPIKGSWDDITKSSRGFAGILPAQATEAARGKQTPPATHVGFGND